MKIITILCVLFLLTGCVSSPNYDGRDGAGTKTRALGNDEYDVVVFEKLSALFPGRYSFMLKLRERAMEKWDLRVKVLTKEKSYAVCSTLYRSGTASFGTIAFGLAEGRIKCFPFKNTNQDASTYHHHNNADNPRNRS